MIVTAHSGLHKNVISMQYIVHCISKIIMVIRYRKKALFEGTILVIWRFSYVISYCYLFLRTVVKTIQLA